MSCRRGCAGTCADQRFKTATGQLRIVDWNVRASEQMRSAVEAAPKIVSGNSALKWQTLAAAVWSAATLFLKLELTSGWVAGVHCFQRDW